MKKYILSIILFFVTSIIFSQSKDWKLADIEKSNFSKDALKFRKSIPTNFKVYELDVQKFKNKISQTKTNESIVIELPTADGVQKFSVQEASSLSEGLAQKFPMIASYVAKGLDNPGATARLSFGTDGFHGVVFYAGQSSFYIDPYTKDYSSYIVYNRSNLPQKEQEFRCDVTEQLDKKKQGIALKEMQMTDY